MTRNESQEFLTRIDGVGSTVAEALLDRYGSVEAVLDAHIAGLQGVSGVGPTVAKNIKDTTERPKSAATETSEKHSDYGQADKQHLTRVDGVGEAVAERLLTRFGSVDAVLDASEHELTAVSGVGKAVVHNIQNVPRGRDGSIKAPPETTPPSGAAVTDSAPTEDDTDEGFTVRNIVLSGDLGIELLLDAVRMDMPHTTVAEGHSGLERLVYDPPRRNGTARLTTTGQLLIAGVTSLEEADDLKEAFLDDLPPVGLEDTSLDLTVNNVVATATVDNPVPPAGLAEELHGPDADYDPSSFPGFSFTHPEAACTFTLFGSGKVTITGADSVEDAEAAFETLNDLLDGFDPEALSLPNDAVHDRLDAIATDLAVDGRVLATAHEIVDVYDAAVTGSARNDDGIAAMALYVASDSLTQSTVAEAADVSVVTIRNISNEFRDSSEHSLD